MEKNFRESSERRLLFPKSCEIIIIISPPKKKKYPSKVERWNQTRGAEAFKNGWSKSIPAIFLPRGRKKFTKRGGGGEKTGGSLGEGRPSSLRREIRAARPLIWIGGRHSRGKERKGETETGEKVTRQSRGIHACETWKRKGGEEGWRRDNRCIKIPNLNERSFRSSSNGGLSTVACFLSNDLTTIFETIAALSRVASRVLVSNPTSKLSLFILFFFFYFLMRRFEREREFLLLLIRWFVFSIYIYFLNSIRKYCNR